METTPALYVQPNGHTEPFYLHGEPKRQQCDIADELEGPVTAWRLGRHMTVHTATPAYERTRNEIVRAAWRDLAGGSAPDLRGPAIITGPPRRDGLLQPLAPHSFERVQYWARLRHSAAVRRRPQVSAAQAVGTRDLQCDAHAAHRFPDSGRWAFVVLDGIGDEQEVQDHVRTWAPALARAASLPWRPGRGDPPGPRQDPRRTAGAALELLGPGLGRGRGRVRPRRPVAAPGLVR